MPLFDPLQNAINYIIANSDSTSFIFQVSLIGMLFTAFEILKADFKYMIVKMWQILLFILVGFIGLWCAKWQNGTLSWVYALIPFFYAFLTFLNTKFNNSKIIGVADLDIFNGVLSIIFCAGLDLLTHEFGAYTLFVRTAKICGLLTNMLTFLLFGFIVAIVAAFLKWFIRAIQLKLNLSVEIKKKVIDANLAVLDPKRALEDKISDIKKAYAGNKLLKTKIPVCISFVPAFIATVYFVIYL